MSKAFDKVDHTKLLLEGCTNTALLANFTIGSVHTYRDASNRLRQGSLLGPILFLLFVDDLPNTVKTLRVSCYADDTKNFKSIDSITDCYALQSDRNDLVSWSESSGLIFNQSKCKYQCITRKKSPVQPT